MVLRTFQNKHLLNVYPKTGILKSNTCTPPKTLKKCHTCDPGDSRRSSSPPISFRRFSVLGESPGIIILTAVIILTIRDDFYQKHHLKSDFWRNGHNFDEVIILTVWITIFTNFGSVKENHQNPRTILFLINVGARIRSTERSIRLALKTTGSYRNKIL